MDRPIVDLNLYCISQTEYDKGEHKNLLRTKMYTNYFSVGVFLNMNIDDSHKITDANGNTFWVLKFLQNNNTKIYLKLYKEIKDDKYRIIIYEADKISAIAWAGILIGLSIVQPTYNYVLK
jgi:hypothetical protein